MGSLYDYFDATIIILGLVMTNCLNRVLPRSSASKFHTMKFFSCRSYHVVPVLSNNSFVLDFAHTFVSNYEKTKRAQYEIASASFSTFLQTMTSFNQYSSLGLRHFWQNVLFLFHALLLPVTDLCFMALNFYAFSHHFIYHKLKLSNTW
ncbi:hypothetical protein VNO77_28988 [Canavalia gladiata]|uniref:Uncharacterized protein n=1 Tax=Canavalia gladiata TaxID=3824 RepID=A0AAN9KWM7_CANGL